MAKISTISIKLVNGSGFSKGWALLALKNPPPLVPSFFDDFLRGHRPHRERLLGALQSRHLDVGAKILDHSLRNEDQGHGNADRQQDIERGSG